MTKAAIAMILCITSLAGSIAFGDDGEKYPDNNKRNAQVVFRQLLDKNNLTVLSLTLEEGAGKTYNRLMGTFKEKNLTVRQWSLNLFLKNTRTGALLEVKCLGETFQNGEVKIFSTEKGSACPQISDLYMNMYNTALGRKNLQKAEDVAPNEDQKQTRPVRGI